MAKVMIRHTCGHDVEHVVTGTLRLRQWKIDRLMGEECWECRREAENEFARSTSEAAGLVPLEGTPKQVAWATTIRLEKLGAIESWRETVGATAQRLRLTETDEKRLASIDATLDTIDAQIGRLVAETSAKFWIDSRKMTPNEEFLKWHERFLLAQRTTDEASGPLPPMPALNGTERQTDWAVTIRLKKVNGLLALKRSMAGIIEEIDAHVDEAVTEDSAQSRIRQLDGITRGETA